MKNTSQDSTIKNLVSDLNLQHIAVIMDGNRRWAKERHLPSAFGHQKGVDALKTAMRACDDFGIKYLTVYAFSTENWNRKPEEVDFLMNLLAKTLSNELDEMHQENVKITFIGDISRLTPTLQDILKNAESKTMNNTGVNLQIAFNYGSRLEITHALKNIAQQVLSGELNPDDITENTLSQNLYTKGIPDPDLLIRTGGELRVSNYLLWQIAYSEILVIDKYWPEFDKQELANAVLEYEKRNRRFGK